MAAAGFLAALQAGCFRETLIHLLSSRIGRPFRVGGRLDVRLFSSHPRLVAERAEIGNPPWVPPGTAAQIGRLSVVLQLPGFHR